jgi:hypothetical protein
MRWTVLGGALACGLCAAACDSDDEGTTQVPIESAVEAIADHFCARQFACDCLDTRFETEADCETAAQQIVDRIQTDGERLGYDYHPECIGEWLDLVADYGCSPPRAVDPPRTCERTCYMYTGDADLNEPCEYSYSGSVSPCATGLECNGASCQDPCEDWEATHFAAAGDSCLERSCDEELFCNENQVCQALPVAGEPCFNGACASNATCDQSDPDPMLWTCTDLVVLGDPCSGHGQCDSGYCPAGFCAPLPGRGESCEGTSVCGPNLDCHEDVCVPAEAAVCDAPIPFG